MRSLQDGEADVSGADSLGAASLGAELSTGARVSVPVDEPLPDGEHATRAAPIATINKSFFNMN